MKFLYSMEMQKEFIPGHFENLLEDMERDSEKNYARSLIEAFRAHQAEIDARIEASAIGWTLKSMNRVDLAILRVSVTELSFLADIPTEVSINEAMELAKVYSGDEAPSFLNGVLGSVAEAVR